MTVESLPDFTRLARQRWESIPADIRQRLQANVWCGQCRHEVTITDFSGTIKGGGCYWWANAQNAAATRLG